MTKKRIFAAMLAATIMINVTGCQFKYEEDETKASAEDVTTEPTGAGTLRVLYNNKQYQPYLEKCKTEFEKENGDVTIVLEFSDSTEYLEEISKRSTGEGETPDVYLIDNSN